MKRITREGLLVKQGSFLDILIRLLPIWIGHYETVRIGSNLSWVRFSLFKPQPEPTRCRYHGNLYTECSSNPECMAAKAEDEAEEAANKVAYTGYDRWTQQAARALFPYRNGGVTLPLIGKLNHRIVHYAGFDPYSGSEWRTFPSNGRWFKLTLSNVVTYHVALTILDARYKWVEIDAQDLPRIFRWLFSFLEDRYAYFECEVDESTYHPEWYADQVSEISAEHNFDRTVDHSQPHEATAMEREIDDTNYSAHRGEHYI